MSEAFRTFGGAGEHGDRELHFLLTSVIVPRPIAWISTLSPDGTPNIAPFSFTTVLSSEPPPIVCFVATGVKDSLENVRYQGDFVYNVAGEDLLERMNLTSAELHPDESEFEWAKLTPIPSEIVKSPRLGEAPVSMECTLVDIVPFGGGAGFLIAGEVVRLHVAERVFTGDRVDPRKLRPLGRLSGNNYTTLGEILTIKRPTRQELIDLGLQPE